MDSSILESASKRDWDADPMEIAAGESQTETLKKLHELDTR